MHHLADAVPTEVSPPWFLVIGSSVELVYSLAVRMRVPIGVILGFPTDQESVEDVGAQLSSNLRIVHGLNPICWPGVFENFENGHPVGCSRVPENAEAEQESNKELDMVGFTLEDALYGTPRQATPCRKKGAHTPKGGTCRAS